MVGEIPTGEKAATSVRGSDDRLRDLTPVKGQRPVRLKRSQRPRKVGLPQKVTDRRRMPIREEDGPRLLEWSSDARHLGVVSCLASGQRESAVGVVDGVLQQGAKWHGPMVIERDAPGIDQAGDRRRQPT